MAIQASGVDTWLMLNDHVLSFQQDTENRDAGVTEYRECYLRSTPDAPPFLKIYIGGKYLPSDREGFWRWTPKEYAGIYELVVEARDISPFKTRLRVFPHHLLLGVYEEMQQELSEVSIDLLMKLWSMATARTAHAQRVLDHMSPLHDYLKIKALHDQLQELIV